MYTDAEEAQSLMSPVLIFELLNITANNPTEHPLYWLQINTMAAQVIESWKIIKAIPNYEAVAGEMLFRK